MNSPLIGQTVTSKSKSNLALSFFCLPKEQRWAMTVFYAFCRVIDDIADSTVLSTHEKKEGILFWKKEVEKIYYSVPSSPLGKELSQVVHKWNLSQEMLQEIILGVEMDIEKRRYKNFDELSLYCYRVAGAVGLVSIEIFGCRHALSKDYALALGTAFQLTNILRDVPKDSSFGRIYFPLDELEIHGITEEDILSLRWSPKIRDFFRLQYFRAKHYFAKSSKLIHPLDKPKLLAAEIMSSVYKAILEKIKTKQFDVFHHSIRLNKAQKLASILKVLFKHAFGIDTLPSGPPKKVVILGGGFSGVSAALELISLGHEVILLESKSKLGGRAGSFLEPQTKQIIDTGQHIMMGCYQHTLEFVEKIGISSKLLWIDPLKLSFVSEKGTSVLSAGNLPAPFHLLVALLRYSELSVSDWFKAFFFLLSVILREKPSENESVFDWLRRKKQSVSLIRSLWEPLCVAALNLSIEKASAELFYSVLKKTLFGKRKDLSLIFSRVGLSELFSNEFERLINACGGKLFFRTSVCSLEFEENYLKSIKTVDGKEFTSDSIDYFLCALPWHILGSLLPKESSLKKNCESIEQSPILSLYFWVDRSFTDQPVIGFLDSPVQWLFSRNLIMDKELLSFPFYSYVAVISAPPKNILSLNSKEIEQIIWKEVNRLIPRSIESKLCGSFLFKSLGATPKFDPTSLKYRPPVQTEWKNFVIAGDWTDTGLPATIEGAVLSGKKAAQFIDSLTPLSKSTLAGFCTEKRV